MTHGDQAKAKTAKSQASATKKSSSKSAGQAGQGSKGGKTGGKEAGKSSKASGKAAFPKGGEKASAPAPKVVSAAKEADTGAKGRTARTPAVALPPPSSHA